MLNLQLALLRQPRDQMPPYTAKPVIETTTTWTSIWEQSGCRNGRVDSGLRDDFQAAQRAAAQLALSVSEVELG